MTKRRNLTTLRIIRKPTQKWKRITGGIFDLLLLQFGKADEIAFAHIITYLGKIDPSSAVADSVAEALYQIVRHEYNTTLSSTEFKKIVLTQTADVYRTLVKNDSSLPRVSFNLWDERAMVYLEKSDMVYLGRYVDGEALRTRIVDYIRETYIKRGAAIGKSDKELDAFMNAFKSQLDLSRSKVRQIVDTTVSRARVFGQVNGLRAAGGKTFLIAGPNDHLTCTYCQEMLGRVFNVATEINDQERFIDEGPESANEVRPFLKGNLALDVLEDLDDAEVQDLGFATPPYHPSCRHRLVVASFYSNTDEIPYSME